MDFSEALKRMKADRNKQFTRQVWDDPARIVCADNSFLKQVKVMEQTWVPTREDMFADDWVEVVNPS